MKLKLTVRQEGPRAVVTAECPEQGKGLYKAYLLGPGGRRYLLGTLLPEGGGLRLRRIVSVDELSRQGVWPVGEGTAELAFSFTEDRPPAGWDWTDGAGRLFHDPALRPAVSRLGRVLCRREGERVTLACPYRADKEFPLPEFFCFSRVRRMGEGLFCLFTFDEQGWPVAQKE